MIELAHLSATRAGYDAVAEQYAELFRSGLDGSPLDRAMLGGFAELVRSGHANAELLEVGSGPGNVAAHLHGLGMSVRGIDLSPTMVDLARREHPEVDFQVGEMGALDAQDASVAGLVAWYSVIHVPNAQLPAVFAEFHRALRPHGYLLLAFQVGEDTLHLDQAFGHQVSLDFRRLQPATVGLLLEDAGFDLTAQLVRAPDATSAAQKVPQGFLIASKRSTAAH